METRRTSYLAGVKQELHTTVQEIAETDGLDVDAIANRLWKFMEPKLKESFINGKKATGNGNDGSENSRDKPHPFRRR